MAFTIPITFADDALLLEIRDAIASKYGWQGSSDLRGATKAAFAVFIVKDFLKQLVKSVRTEAAQAAIVIPSVTD